MSTIRDFALGIVETAPSPATSGTTLVLQTGQGEDMPTTLPFKLIAYPPNLLPVKSVLEELLVTARTDDTLTIERAQGETTAKTIEAGWFVVNPITTDDIFNGSLVANEVPGGTVDGTNATFTIASSGVTSQNLHLYVNGLLQKQGASDDYTFSGTTITFNSGAIPVSGSNILATYWVGNQINSVGTNSYIANEAVSGSINGSNTVFTTARPYIANSLEVYVNGLKQGTAHVTETDPSAGTFTLDSAPTGVSEEEPADVVEVAYQFNLNPSGNADTVDGIHAFTTPTANSLVPLGSDSKFASIVSNLPVISHHDAGTKTQLSGLRVEEGWHYIQGNNTTILDGTVTFNSAFTSPPTVLISFISAASTGSTPTSTAAFVTPWTSFTGCYTQDITTTNFGVRLQSTGSNHSTSFYFGFSWIAIGT